MCNTKIPRLDLDTLEPTQHPPQVFSRAVPVEVAQAKLDTAYLCNLMGICHNQDPLTLEHCEGCDFLGSTTESPRAIKYGWRAYT